MRREFVGRASIGCFLVLLALSAGSVNAAECGNWSLDFGASWTSDHLVSGYGPLVSASGECGPKNLGSEDRLWFRGAVTWTVFENEASARHLLLDANAIYYVGMPSEGRAGFYVTGGVSGTRYSSHLVPDESGAVEYFAGYNAGFGFLFGSPAHQPPFRLDLLYRDMSKGAPDHFLTASVGFLF